MGHHIAGLLLVISCVIYLGAAQSTLFDKYCTNPDKTSYMAPFPTDSSKFVWCQDGTFTVMTCNTGDLFDCDAGACRSSTEAQTCAVEKPVIPDYISEYCLTEPVGTSLPALTCNQYYVCEGQIAVQLTCPAGQQYSRAYSACMSPLKAGCKVLETMCLSEDPGYKFASLQCNDYYICNKNQVPVLTNCSEGLYYSMALGECTLPDVSDCIPEEPLTTTTTTSGTTTTVAYGSVPNCNTNNNGIFYPHPKCNWFYMCFNCTALEMQCECGQYYNNALKYCIQDTNGLCKAS